MQALPLIYWVIGKLEDWYNWCTGGLLERFGSLGTTNIFVEGTYGLTLCWLSPQLPAFFVLPSSEDTFFSYRHFLCLGILSCLESIVGFDIFLESKGVRPWLVHLWSILLCFAWQGYIFLLVWCRYTLFF